GAGAVGEARVAVRGQPPAIQAERRAETEEEQRPAAARMSVQAADERAVRQRRARDRDNASPAGHETRRGYARPPRMEAPSGEVARAPARPMKPAAAVMPAAAAVMPTTAMMPAAGTA